MQTVSFLTDMWIQYLHIFYTKKLSHMTIHLVEARLLIQWAVHCNLKQCHQTGFKIPATLFKLKFQNCLTSKDYQYFSKLDTNFCKAITCYKLTTSYLWKTSEKCIFLTRNVTFVHSSMILGTNWTTFKQYERKGEKGWGRKEGKLII